MQGDYLIICTGSTLKHYKTQITDFWSRSDKTTVIGVNKMTILPIEDLIEYNLWTNQGGFKRHYVSNGKRLILSKKLWKSVPRISMNWSKNKQIREAIVIHDDIKIWRNAGCRAIQYAHDQGANNIYVVGKDGFTLKYKGDQHCWGSGYTDNSDMVYAKDKDNVIYNCLRGMKNKGVNFKILTPTIYEEFYDGSVL